MELFLCTKCGIEKNIYAYQHSFSAENDLLKRQSTICKKCKGIKSVNPVDKNIKLVNEPYSHNSLMSIITRLDNHNGMAKTEDILPLTNMYYSIFENIPGLSEVEDKYSFMYLKLKKFIKHIETYTGNKILKL